MTDIFKQVDQQVQSLIREAAQNIILPAFRGQVSGDQICVKNDHSIVTKTDYDVQHFMQDKLVALLPGSAFLGEEETDWRNHDTHEWVWILDPIDGTHNFAAQSEEFGTMVCLWHLPTGRPLYGWIYMPVADLMFSGGEGEGVFSNGESLTSLTKIVQRQLKEMVGLMNYGSFGSAKDTMQKNSHRFRTIDPSSCAAMKFVAMLQDKADFAVFGRAKIWDLCAGFALMQEIGGHACRVNFHDDAMSKLNLDNLSDYAGWHLVVRHKKDWPLVRDQLFENVIF